MVVKYFIPQKRGNLIPVCLDAFFSVTSITRRRLNIGSKTFKQNHSSSTEKRGGIRVDLIQDEITDSVKQHIKEREKENSEKVIILIRILAEAIYYQHILLSICGKIGTRKEN